MSKDSRGRFAASKNRVTVLAEARDAPAAKMFDRLSDAEFGGKQVSHGEAPNMLAETNALIQNVQGLAQQAAGK